MELIRHCTSGTNFATGKTGSPYDFTCRSIYRNPRRVSNGKPLSAIAMIRDEYDKVSAILGRTKPEEIHEFGIVNNEWGNETFEPGAYGAAWTFSTLMGLYSEGLTKIQHWVPFEDFKTTPFNLILGEYWPYMILDYMLEGDTYKLVSPPDSAAGTQYDAYVVDKGNKKYILLSASNNSRNTTDLRTITLDVSDEVFKIADKPVIKEVKLTTENSLYDIIRKDLASEGLLLKPWTTQPGAVDWVQKMAGPAGEEYVMKNFEKKYRKIFEDSLTLMPFEGTYSKTSAGSQFSVTITNPTVMALEITAP